MNNTAKIKEARYILLMLGMSGVSHDEVNARVNGLTCGGIFVDFREGNYNTDVAWYAESNPERYQHPEECCGFQDDISKIKKYTTSLDACMELLQKKVPFLERAGNSIKSISYLYVEYGFVRKTVSCNYSYFTFSRRARVKGGFGCDLFYDSPFYRENSTKTGVIRIIGSHRFMGGGSTECLALLYTILKSYIHTWEQEDEST